MKKTAVIFLSLLFLFSLAACGGGRPGGTKPGGSDASTSAPEQTTAAPEVSPVETDLSAYTLTVQPMDHERETEPTFSGLHMGVPAPYDTDEVRLNLAAAKADGGETLFSIFVKDAFPSFYVQEGNPVTAALRAKNGNKWLFSIKGNIEEDQDYYIYDADADRLLPLEEASTVLYFGERILLCPAAYAEEALPAAHLFDWQGGIVTGYIDVSDLRQSGDTLYMLRFFEPAELHAISAAKLANAPAQELTSEKLCEFGPYYGMFCGDDSIVIQPLAGGYPVTCLLTEAADTVNALLRGEDPNGNTLTERCAAFSVSLPASWKDRYICEEEDDGLIFRFKASPDDDEGIYLFYIGVTSGPETLEDDYIDGPGVNYEVCKIEKNGFARYITVSEPDEDGGIPDAVYDDYLDMLRLTDTVGFRVQGENGYTVTPLDYADALGVYTGTDSLGGRYTLTFTDTRYNMLVGTLSYAYQGDMDTIEDVSARMFSNAGLLRWYRQTAGSDDWEIGSGVFMIEDEGWSLNLRAPGDSWTNTGDYLSIERVSP